jgi:hypothetical protein
VSLPVDFFFFLVERVRPPFVMRGGVIRVDKSQEDQSWTLEIRGEYSTVSWKFWRV